MTEPLDRPLLLQAALDGELDAAGMLAFERALAEDEALAAEYRSLQSLRGVLQTLPKADASADLRRRVEALAGAAPAARRAPPGSWQRWLPTGMAAGLAFLLGGGLAYLLLPQAPAMQIAELAGDHMRGLIAGQPVDVASSERHTVKPWFASHTALSPEVVDLAAAGFPLIGGRVDVVGVTPVPTLVYRRHAHVISLAEMPNAIAHLKEGRSSIQGLSVLAWRQGPVTYVAISDAMPAELDALKLAFQKATGASP